MSTSVMTDDASHFDERTGKSKVPQPVRIDGYGAIGNVGVDARGPPLPSVKPPSASDAKLKDGLLGLEGADAVPAHAAPTRVGQPYRYFMLMLCCSWYCVAYTAYDVPSVVSAPVKHDLGIGNNDLGLLFSAYSIPNMVLPAVFGVAFAMCGTRQVTLVLVFVAVLGLSLGVVAIRMGNFWLLVAARGLYGAGAESSMLGIDILATTWFKGSEQSLAFAMITSGGMLGSTTSFLAVSLLYGLVGLDGVFLAVAGAGCGGFVCVMVAVVCIDQRPFRLCKYCSARCGKRDVRWRRTKATIDDHAGTGERTALLSVVGESAGAGGDNDNDTGLLGALQLPGVKQSGELASGDNGGDDDDGGSGSSSGSGDSDGESPSDTATGGPSAFRRKASTILVALVCQAYTVVYYNFQAFGPDYLQTTRGLDLVKSSRVVGLLCLVTLVGSVPVGWVIAKLRLRFHAVAGAGLVAAVGSFYVIEWLPQYDAEYPMIGLAVGYILIPVSLWPLLSLSAGPDAFDKVYTLVFSLVNALTAVVAKLVGNLTHDAQHRKEEHPYRVTIMMFMGILGMGLLCLCAAACVLMPNQNEEDDEDEDDDEGDEDSDATSDDSNVHIVPARPRTMQEFDHAMDSMWGDSEALRVYRSTHAAWRQGSTSRPAGDLSGLLVLHPDGMLSAGDQNLSDSDAEYYGASAPSLRAGFSGAGASASAGAGAGAPSAGSRARSRSVVRRAETRHRRNKRALRVMKRGAAPSFGVGGRMRAASYALESKHRRRAARRRRRRDEESGAIIGVARRAAPEERGRFSFDSMLSGSSAADAGSPRGAGHIDIVSPALASHSNAGIPHATIEPPHLSLPEAAGSRLPVPVVIPHEEAQGADASLHPAVTPTTLVESTPSSVLAQRGLHASRAAESRLTSTSL